MTMPPDPSSSFDMLYERFQAALKNTPSSWRTRADDRDADARRRDDVAAARDTAGSRRDAHAAERFAAAEKRDVPANLRAAELGARLRVLEDNARDFAVQHVETEAAVRDAFDRMRTLPGASHAVIAAAQLAVEMCVDAAFVAVLQGSYERRDVRDHLQQAAMAQHAASLDRAAERRDRAEAAADREAACVDREYAALDRQQASLDRALG